MKKNYGRLADTKMVSTMNMIMRESGYKKPRSINSMEYNEIKKRNFKFLDWGAIF